MNNALRTSSLHVPSPQAAHREPDSVFHTCCRTASHLNSGRQSQSRSSLRPAGVEVPSRYASNEPVFEPSEPARMLRWVSLQVISRAVHGYELFFVSTRSARVLLKHRCMWEDRERCSMGLLLDIPRS